MGLLIFSIIVIVLVGLLVWAVSRYLQIDSGLKNLLCFLVIVAGAIMIAERAGLF